MSRTLRVAMITPFPEQPDRVAGGVAGVARCLAAELALRGDTEVVVVAPGPRREVREWQGCLLEYVPRPRMPGIITYWTEVRRRLLAVADSWAPDVVHVQAMAAWTLGCRHPNVLTIHGISENDTRLSGRTFSRLRAAVMARTERAGRTRATDVIVISPYVEEVLAEQLPGRIWRIENPIDPRFFSVERNERAGQILFLGVLNHRKNLRGLLAALARVSREIPDVRLRVAGATPDPAYLETCRHYIARHGLEEHVELVGNLKVDEVERELARASCLVLPSFQETAPLAIAEAMASGVPVVASRRFGIPHMVEDGKTGLLCDPDSPESIASALVRVLGDDELRRSMSVEGRRVARSRFEPTAIAERTRGVYESLATGSAASPPRGSAML